MSAPQNLSPPAETRPPRRLWKSWLFRLLAILLGLSPFLLLELACRLFGWGLPTYYDDPYVGFSAIHPLFVLNEESDRYEIPKSRLKFFCKESFPAHKPEGQYRVFVLGGSTVQGRPYEIDTAFTTWLELDLKAAEPNRDWDVINCGGISYASYRLVPILEEVLDHEADLIIICTGHNEFLEDRTYGHIKKRNLSWPEEQVARLRTYNLLRGGYLAMTGQDRTVPSPDRPLLGPEADARLDWKGGMAQYVRDDIWRKDVIQHFGYNLRHMADICRRRDVPLVFVCPVSNLDWPPFKSTFSEDLTESDREQLQQILDDLEGAPLDPEIRIELLEKAQAIDDRYAVIHFQLGQWYEAVKSFAEAKGELERALEEDVCPLRMLAPMQTLMREIAAETDTPIVDAQELFAGKSPHGITGDDWLIDHVHPTITGHKLLGRELFAELQRLHVVDPQPGWEERSDAAQQNHFRSLRSSYFFNGQERLRSTQGWAYGKAKRTKKAKAPTGDN